MGTIVLGLVCPSVFFFNVRSFLVDNVRLFHFFILSVMSVETDKKTDCGLFYLITWPTACPEAANVGAMQFNATFYHTNVTIPFKY